MKVLILEPELERDLGALVDKFGIGEVFSALGTVCEKKASEKRLEWDRLAKMIKEFYEDGIKRYTP